MSPLAAFVHRVFPFVCSANLSCRQGAQRGAAISRLARVFVSVSLFLLMAAGITEAAKAQTATVGANWVQRSPATAPPARAFGTMAYDATAGTVLLFGGTDTNNQSLNDTWMWNGTNWTKLTPASSPTARTSAMMAYDAASGNTVLFGGIDANSTVLNDTWTWDGSTWTKRSPATSPSARFRGSMAYDAATGNVVLFGGLDGSSNSLSDTWTWNGTTWTKLTPATSPSGRAAAVMAYDAATGTMVLFGGINAGSYPSDTWTWDGSTWTQQSPATSPAGRSRGAMTYNANTGTVLLFSGTNGSGALNDMWSWNGANWISLSPAARPGVRSSTAMTYDSARGNIVLFGGNNGVALADTWTYAGGSFTAPATNVGTAAAVTPVYFTIGTAGTLGTPVVSTQGAAGLDFTLSTPGTNCTGALSSGTNCIVNIAFKPTAVGPRYGSVKLTNSGGTVIATASISGTGIAPLAGYSSSASAPTTVFDDDGRLLLSIAVDAAANLYLTDHLKSQASQVKKIAPGCAAVSCSTTIGGPLGTSAGGVAVDGAGNVYVVGNTTDGTINIIPPGCISASCMTDIGFKIPDARAVALDRFGNLYVSLYLTGLVKEVPAGCVSASCVLTVADGFNGPVEIALDGAGNLYVAGENYPTGVKMIPAGCMNSQCVKTVIENQAYYFHLAVDGAGNVYAGGGTNPPILSRIPAGCASPSCVVSLGTQFPSFEAMTADGSGNLYLAQTSGLVSKAGFHTPPTVAFDPTGVGTTSSTKTVVITNLGNAPLSFPVPTTGGNPSASTSFALSNTSTCSLLTPSSFAAATLVPTASCSLGITFSPTTFGTVTGQALVTNNSMNVSPSAVQSIPLTGTGIFSASKLVFTTAPAATVTPGGNGGVLKIQDLDPLGNHGPAGDTITMVVAYPDGDAHYYDAVTDANGIATYNLSSIPLTLAGRYDYRGIAFGLNSDISSQLLTASTKTVLTSSSNPSIDYSVITYTAKVSIVAPATGTPLGTVTFAAPGMDPQVFGLDSNGQATATFTFTTENLVNVTATFTSFPSVPGFASSTSSVQQVITHPVRGPYNYLVTTLADDATGVAANCIAGAVNATGGNGNCTLRDAIEAANAVGLSGVSSATTISFLGSLASAATPGTITITTGGTLHLTQPVTIQGPGANALSLSGGDSTTILSVAGVKVNVSGLGFRHGSGQIGSATSASAIAANGSVLTLADDEFTDNSTAVPVNLNAGYLTVTGSTFASNNTQGPGGILLTASHLELTNSTFANNVGAVGAIGTSSSINLYQNLITNSTFSGNNSTQGSAVSLDNGIVRNSIFVGNLGGYHFPPIFASGNITALDNVYYDNETQYGTNCYHCVSDLESTTGDPKLSVLGNYGGNTQTMLPLPGSAAICASAVNTSAMPDAASNQEIADQRGLKHSTAYCPATQMDAGAVQTSYSLGAAFTVQPPSIVLSNTVITPNPAVTLTEGGAAFNGATVTIAAAKATLSGTTSKATAATGLATFGNLKIATVQSGDTLTATLVLNAAASVSVTSTAFSGITLAAPATLSATVGVPYSQGVSVANGAAPYMYQVSAGSLPAGLALSAATGMISGTPTAGGSFTLSVKVTDSAGATATAGFTLLVAAPTITLSPSTLPALTVGATPVASLIAGGGIAPYAYSLIAGNLPAGLVLSPNGVITGTPTTAGAFNFTVKATDSSTGTGPYFGYQSYYGNITAGAATVMFNPATLSQTYTGSPLAATATTTPANLALTYSYTGTGSTTYPSSATPPTNAGTYTVTATIGDSNYTGTATSALVIAKATAPIVLGGLSPTYSGSPLAATATTTPAGLNVNLTYNGSTTAPTAAGSYTLAATINSPNYTGTATGTLVIAKAAATVALSNLAQIYNGSSLPATATTTPAGLNVGLTYNGSTTAPTTAGSYNVVATINDANYSGTASGTLVIAKAAATVALSNLAQTYSGSPLPATATTTPAGLNVGLTYNGSTTVPTAAGSYAVVATINNGNYSGTASGTLIIAKANAAVALSNLAQTYTGSALAATATTTPAGLSVNLTYNGSSAAPTAAGSYTVVATINDTNYSGAATGTLVIAKANASVGLNGLSQTYTGSPLAAGATTSPAGLAVGITYNGNSTAPTVTGSYAVVATINDGNYAGTSAGTLVIAKANAQISLSNLSATYNGSAHAATASTTPASLSTVTLSYSGTGGTTYGPSAAAPTAVGSYPVTATLANDNYTATQTGTLVITAAELAITAANASRVYGAANPVFSGSISGQQPGDAFTESFTTQAVATSAPGQYAIVPSVTGANVNNYTVMPTNGTLTVTKANTTAALSASSLQITPVGSVTLTASVVSTTTGTPTGTVAFYDGATALSGSIAIVNGQAQYTVQASTLTPGVQHSFGLQYSGDMNFNTSASTASAGSTVTVAPNDFAFTLNIGQSFTVIPGKSISYSFQVTPTYTLYPGTVTFTATGLPPGATAVFSPATIAANGGTQTVTMTIQTVLAENHPAGRNLAPITFALLLLPLAGLRRGRRKLRAIGTALLLLVGLATAAGITGCGSSGFLSQTPKDYTVTVTATSGSTVHTSTFTLNVQ